MFPSTRTGYLWHLITSASPWLFVTKRRRHKYGEIKGHREVNMYRVSRERRRGSADTPPKSLRHRFFKLHGHFPSGSKDKLFLHDSNVRLGLKITGVLLILLIVRQTHYNMCRAHVDSYTDVPSRRELEETLDQLAKVKSALEKEQHMRLDMESELMGLRAGDGIATGDDREVVDSLEQQMRPGQSRLTLTVQAQSKDVFTADNEDEQEFDVELPALEVPFIDVETVASDAEQVDERVSSVREDGVRIGKVLEADSVDVKNDGKAGGKKEIHRFGKHANGNAESWDSFPRKERREFGHLITDSTLSLAENEQVDEEDADKITRGGGEHGDSIDFVQESGSREGERQEGIVTSDADHHQQSTERSIVAASSDEEGEDSRGQENIVFVSESHGGDNVLSDSKWPLHFPESSHRIAALEGVGFMKPEDLGVGGEGDGMEFEVIEMRVESDSGTPLEERRDAEAPKAGNLRASTNISGQDKQTPRVSDGEEGSVLPNEPLPPISFGKMEPSPAKTRDRHGEKTINELTNVPESIDGEKPEEDSNKHLKARSEEMYEVESEDNSRETPKKPFKNSGKAATSRNYSEDPLSKDYLNESKSGIGADRLDTDTFDPDANEMFRKPARKFGKVAPKPRYDEGPVSRTSPVQSKSGTLLDKPHPWGVDPNAEKVSDEGIASEAWPRRSSKTDSPRVHMPAEEFEREAEAEANGALGDAETDGSASSGWETVKERAEKKAAEQEHAEKERAERKQAEREQAKQEQVQKERTEWEARREAEKAKEEAKEAQETTAKVKLELAKLQEEVAEVRATIEWGKKMAKAREKHIEREHRITFPEDSSIDLFIKASSRYDAQHSDSNSERETDRDDEYAEDDDDDGGAERQPRHISSSDSSDSRNTGRNANKGSALYSASEDDDESRRVKQKNNDSWGSGDRTSSSFSSVEGDGGEQNGDDGFSTDDEALRWNSNNEPKNFEVPPYIQRERDEATRQHFNQLRGWKVGRSRQ